MPNITIIALPPDFHMAMWFVVGTVVSCGAVYIAVTLYQLWQHADPDRPIQALDESYKYDTNWTAAGDTVPGPAPKMQTWQRLPAIPMRTGLSPDAQSLKQRIQARRFQQLRNGGRP